MPIRPAALSYFRQSAQNPDIIRGQNYTARRVGYDDGSVHALSSAAEMLFIFPDGGSELRRTDGALNVPPRALVIAPPGDIELRLSGPGAVFVLTTGVAEPAWASAINAADYRTPDPRVKPVGAPLRAADGRREGLRLYRVDDMPFPPGNARLKFLQTATMSVNWVEYEGVRNRSQLSPHAHDDFEQGSLAIAGTFVHHIRTPWVSDANEWRDDQHIEASSGSVLVIPPHLIHTTEGVGSGKHILIDIFAPPRADFIAKGWVHNAADYVS